jgi:hypothetical protein
MRATDDRDRCASTSPLDTRCVLEDGHDGDHHDEWEALDGESGLACLQWDDEVAA